MTPLLFFKKENTKNKDKSQYYLVFKKNSLAFIRGISSTQKQRTQEEKMTTIQWEAEVLSPKACQGIELHLEFGLSHTMNHLGQMMAWMFVGLDICDAI